MTENRSHPDVLGLKYLQNAVMSNCDHKIDLKVAGQLQEGGCYAQYAGWNFCGYVWWEDQTFHCEVWIYHSPQEIVSGSLEAIMDTVCEKYGDD